ncbi:hypothetical protein RFI_08811 [Reticulomyxa filosa]|uniref:Uncharacterized protein n=1 Tax=Reticulomyxa filosa TaxID=46433 RepID=X6NQN6_RETFI|nr:hypothetical protein RFI_08811 [Reticulomyxa filosa]|eukprot:ETO28321.1 hypothetical protein RFI_08811 [Reticulomyxa filosa]
MLILLENNTDKLPTDWFLSNNSASYFQRRGEKGDHVQQRCKQYSLHYDTCAPWLPELLVPHIALRLQKIRVLMKQIPTESYTNVTIGKVEVFEFLPPAGFQHLMQIPRDEVLYIQCIMTLFYMFSQKKKKKAGSSSNLDNEKRR